MVGKECPTIQQEVSVNRQYLGVVWRILLALYISTSLYEGYLTIPGLGPHSVFSLIQRVLVFTLPFVVLYMVIRGDRRLIVPLVSLTLWLFLVGITFIADSPHTYYYFYYVWSQVGGYLLVLSFWYLALYPEWLRWTLRLAIPIYFSATMVLSLWEIKTAHHLAQSRENGLHPTHIPTAFYFDPNNLGTALALMLPFIVFLGILWRRRWVYWVSAVLTLVGLFVLYKTGSRGGELALVLDLAALPVVLRGRSRTIALSILGLIVVVMVAAIVSLQSLPSTAHLPFALVKLKHMVDLLNFSPHKVTAHRGPGSVMIRLALLKSGLHALSLHPMGLGPRGAERYYAYWLHHPSPYNTYGIIDAHNMWLENAIDFGWAGLALYALFYFWVLIGLFRLINHHDPMIRFVTTAGVPALFGFILGSLSPSSVMIGFNVMWVVYGMGVAAISLSQICQHSNRIQQQRFDRAEES